MSAVTPCGSFAFSERLWDKGLRRSFVFLTLAFGVQIAPIQLMQGWLWRGVWKASLLPAFALVILACTLPLQADTVAAHPAARADGLFAAPLLGSAVDGSSTVTDRVFHLSAGEDGLALDALLPEERTTDYSQQWLWFDDRSEPGTSGVNRLVLMVILFGAVARFLTSDTFYRWAADVFGPCNWD